MADRCLLTLHLLDAFAAWAAGEGWVREENKGVYDVLRLRREKVVHVFYRKNSATVHATVPDPAHSLVRRWIRSKRKKGY